MEIPPILILDVGIGSKTGVPGDPFSLETLNAKSVKTNMAYVQCLAKTHPIILVPEHWLYGLKTAIAQQVFDNVYLLLGMSNRARSDIWTFGSGIRIHLEFHVVCQANYYRARVTELGLCIGS